jgi:glycosyltransferase involved in cell wall biosynthesis
LIYRMERSSPNRRIHLWMPEIFGRVGGIQTYSAFLLEALKQPHFKCSVFLKHDPNYPPGFSASPNFSYHFSGAWPSSIRTQAFATKVLSLGAWEQPNLIIATHLNFAAAAYWLKSLTGVPYWVVAHGVEAWGLERADLRRALRHADRLLAVSKYTSERLIEEQDIAAEKITLLANTFRPADFRIAAKPEYLLSRYGLKSEQPVILTVARLAAEEKYKGCDRILQALPQIRQSLNQAHYVLVGDGDDRPRLEHMVDALGLRDCVTFAGFVPKNELCDHYNLCDVFAMPSKGEGFGIVYLEALACGKPVLAGNSDGSVDALLNGELGALVDPDDINEIASSIVGILRGDYPNPLMYQREMLRDRVSEVYGFNRFAHDLSRHINDFFASRQ